MRTQEPLESSSEKVSTEENVTLIVAEYNALRAEVLKRIEIRHQLTSLALIAPGTILAVGFQAKNSFLMLSYPILACFLWAVWLANARGIHEIGYYLKILESKVGENNIGWEHSKTPSHRPYRFIGYMGSVAIFIFTELLTLLAGISIGYFDAIEKILLFFSIISIVITIMMFVILEIQRLHLLPLSKIEVNHKTVSRNERKTRTTVDASRQTDTKQEPTELDASVQ